MRRQLTALLCAALASVGCADETSIIEIPLPDSVEQRFKTVIVFREGAGATKADVVDLTAEEPVLPSLEEEYDGSGALLITVVGFSSSAEELSVAPGPAAEEASGTSLEELLAYPEPIPDGSTDRIFRARVEGDALVSPFEGVELDSLGNLTAFRSASFGQPCRSLVGKRDGLISLPGSLGTLDLVSLPSRGSAILLFPKSALEVSASGARTSFESPTPGTVITAAALDAEGRLVVATVPEVWATNISGADVGAEVFRDSAAGFERLPEREMSTRGRRIVAFTHARDDSGTLYAMTHAGDLEAFTNGLWSTIVNVEGGLLDPRGNVRGELAWFAPNKLIGRLAWDDKSLIHYEGTTRQNESLELEAHGGLRGITETDLGVVAIASSDGHTEIHRRGKDGTWTQLGDTLTNLVEGEALFGIGAGFMFAGRFGYAVYHTGRRFCDLPEGDDVITSYAPMQKIYEIASLDESTFLLAGTRGSRTGTVAIALIGLE